MKTLYFVLIIAFILLGYFVSAYPPSSIDLCVSTTIQKYHTVTLDHFMFLISWFGYSLVAAGMAVLVGTVFYLFNCRREAIFIVLTLSSGLISSIIKLIINRPRPTKELVRIVEVAKHQSFPSGHTMFYVMFFGFLIVAMSHLKAVPKPLKVVVTVLSALMILLIPFSRIYLGAHWFTDVLGGAISGCLCLFVLKHFYLVENKQKL